MRVWPVIRAVLQTGPAPSARAEAAAALLDGWRGAGSSRLDRELDGKIDDPGAAVMDAAWPRLGGRGDEPGARAARRRARRAARTKRRCRSRRLGVHLGLVRLRRQGSADTARPRRSAARTRGATAVRACSRPAARRSGRRSTRRRPSSRSKQGPAPSSWRADATGGADSVHVRRALRHHALVEPADLPAAHVVLGPPTSLTRRLRVLAQAGRTSQVTKCHVAAMLLHARGRAGSVAK